jgi:omega-amidase
MNVQDSKRANIQKALSMLEKAVLDGAELAVLPEMFNCPYDIGKFHEYAEDIHTGETIKAISQFAKQKRISIVAGSIPECENGLLYNTSFVFGCDGTILGRYRKNNLFKINIPNTIEFDEGKVLTCGKESLIVEVNGAKIGIAICFDLRFPDVFKKMCDLGAEIFIIPGCFNMSTGPAHWELLLRARAVDYQVFVAGVSTARNLEYSYVSYGNTMLVDPWGNVIVRMGEDEKVQTSTIFLDEVKKNREKLPIR